MVKPFLDYNAQLQKLQTRGCQIDDPAFARAVLSRVNYYRFSAYLLPFKDVSENYKPGTNFTTVYHTYEFDRKLRAILFAAIARIEILFRSQISYYHAGKYTPLGYLDIANFGTDKKRHDRFLNDVESEIDKNKTVLFVKHHIENYGKQFPLWVMSELFTFGMLSRFYADLKTPDQKQLARKLCTQSNVILKNWLRCCTILRNICAHHGRIYYRLFSIAPVGFKTFSRYDQRRLYVMLLVLKDLYPNKTEWKSEVCDALDVLISQYQKDIDLQYIGFPQNWFAELTK
jgi:abortive infection bacteriophage resistance protein